MLLIQTIKETTKGILFPLVALPKVEYRNYFWYLLRTESKSLQPVEFLSPDMWTELVLACRTSAFSFLYPSWKMCFSGFIKLAT